MFYRYILGSFLSVGNKVCGINMGATCGSFILKPSHGSYLKQTCIYTSIPLKALMWCDAYNSIFLVLSFRALQDFFFMCTDSGYKDKRIVERDHLIHVLHFNTIVVACDIELQ